MNPYPSAYDLRVEREADRLLRKQSEATAAFRKALAMFTAAFDALEFPLGCPVAGYDLSHISGVLSDFAIGVDDDEQLAMDLAAAAE